MLRPGPERVRIPLQMVPEVDAGPEFVSNSQFATCKGPFDGPKARETTRISRGGRDGAHRCVGTHDVVGTATPQGVERGPAPPVAWALRPRFAHASLK